MTSAATSVALTVDDLPDEVLEFVLGLVSPYNDLHRCMQVCKRWRRCVRNVTKIKRRQLQKAITDNDVSWESAPGTCNPSITKRYSHNAAVHDNSMYVFGGCTCNMTTFNDLWRLDLSTRQWVRLLTQGNYPSPKACSSMVCYKDSLVLFGGWTYPPSYPLHQSWFLFNELHIYDIKENRWNSINNIEGPPPTAGHSVSVHGDCMVIFGGLQRPCNLVHSTKTNEVWKLDLKDFTWHKPRFCSRFTPTPRYGQSQIALDDHNMLIIGGSGGPNFYYNDVWLLNMSSPLWTWCRVQVQNESDGPTNIWSNPACKVGDKVIILNKTRNSTLPPLMYYAKGVWETRRNPAPSDARTRRIDLADRQVDRDENVNGRRGFLRYQRRPRELVEDVGPNGNLQYKKIQGQDKLNLVAFATGNQNPPPSVSPSRREQLEKRVDNLKGLLFKAKPDLTKMTEPKRNALGLYVLDISHALDKNPYVTWLPCVKDACVYDDGPEETILYTLVEGKAELIMFGGIQKNPASILASTVDLSNQVSNSLHFISAPSYII